MEAKNNFEKCCLHLSRSDNGIAGTPRDVAGTYKEKDKGQYGCGLCDACKTRHGINYAAAAVDGVACDCDHREFKELYSGIPTISTGIPNVPTGHCSKTLAILQLSLKDINEQMNMSVRWLMLVDDDTLLSVPRVGALLSCYNHTDNIYVGERYGYRLYAPDGFNYHTGGAGIVFSLPLVRLIVEHCSCPTANAPDDMILGYCLQALGVWAIPGNGLHQARPQDYARELLQQNLPLSFHKFSNTQPEHTYKRWLGGSGGNQSLHHAQLDHNNNNKNKNNGQQATSEHFRDPLQLPIMMAANGKHLDL
ncbi:beta-1,3-glucosyltransferase isoform X3 [Drosophila tropicalis]|uniref:beta-1,3-glucosyltransferase isoform X3 n=1 Tax=Drosophila tropicalis TaxID=46794 RepID=UPI0035AC1BBF